MKEQAAVALDTGPLVALCNDSDSRHSDCVNMLKQLSGRTSLLTIEPVITEAFFLLQGHEPSMKRLAQLLQQPVIEIFSISKPLVAQIVDTIIKYKNLELDYADAALMKVCEELNITSVFTLDRRDFEIYRPKHIKRFKLIP